MEKIKWQEGTVEEAGVNGYQVVDVLEETIDKIKEWDSNLSCEENEETIKALKAAIYWQNKRTEDRESRKVESTYNK